MAMDTALAGAMVPGMPSDQDRTDPIAIGLLVVSVGLLLSGLWTGYTTYRHLERSYTYGARVASIEADREDAKESAPGKYHREIDAAYEAKAKKRDRKRKRWEKKGYASGKWAVGLLLAGGIMGLVRRRWLMHRALRQA